jgi:hypothetical protein
VHWGTLGPEGLGRVRRDRFELPARRFEEEARRVAPAVAVQLVEPGGHLDLAAGPGRKRSGPHGTHGVHE